MTEEKKQITSTVGKTDDGTVQITFTIPKARITEEEKHVLSEITKEKSIPGFRKGKAPLEKVRANIDTTVLIEKTLNHILPKAFSDAIVEHKIKPAMFPKFEILSQTNDWQVRATTCEIADFELSDYKKVISGEGASKKLWTPEKGHADKPKELTQQEKEQIVLKALLDNTKIQLPKIVIDEEVNGRLAQLLERIEKLGLNFDSYLSSIGKDAKALRVEYEEQTKTAVALELILNKIADNEKVDVEEKTVDEALKASGQASTDNPDTRRAIRSILRRRQVLDSLVTLI